ncbi:S9 family peptidase [candidate division KSB1 bacterium]
MKIRINIIVSILLCASVASTQTTGKKHMTMREALMLPSWGSYTWSPDDSKIAFTKAEIDTGDFSRMSHIWLYDVDSGDQMQLTNSHEGESNPRWLKDGRLVFNSSRDGENRMYVISLRGGEAVRFFDDDEAPASGTFSHDQTRIAFTEETERPDKDEWEEKVKKKDDAYYWEKKLTYRHIWVYDVESGAKKQVTSGNFDNSGPIWSPDDEWIAFSSNRSGILFKGNNNSDIWIVSSDSGAVRQLTANEGPDTSPSFSPDGKTIAYLSSPREGHGADHMDLMLVPFEGGAPRNLTEGFDVSVSSPGRQGLVWSKDGQYLYFRAGPSPSNYMYRIPAAGGEIEKISPDDEYVYGGAELSENGIRWLFTGSSYRTTGEVFTADLNFRNIRNIMSPTNHMGEFEIALEEVVNWKGADGWDINGILTYPLNYEPGKRYPTILMVHGGPYGMYSKSFSSGTQIWAARGYAVIRGNPRGSSGQEFKFGHANNMDWGGKDFEDLMAGVDYVIGKGVADPERFGIMGGSYGGFMTFWTITQTDRFKAAIGHAAIADWFSFYGQTDIPWYIGYGFGGYPWETKSTYEKYSPIEYIQNVTTPILITHGEEDLRVNLQQGWQYYRSLMMLNKTVEFLAFPREGHGIRESLHRLHLDREQEKWMAKYLMPERYAEIIEKEKEEKAKKQ